MILERVKKTMRTVVAMKAYYLMFLPVLLYFVIFHYLPMYGITLAFKEFRINLGILGSPWVGFENFKTIMSGPDIGRVLYNTVVISFLKVVVAFPIPIIFALLINELRHKRFKVTIQTISYLPYFMSWVILGSFVIEILSPSRGVINYIITLFGGETIYFMSKPEYFKMIAFVSYVWQSVGWNSVVYLAAIAGIDSEQYESAHVDGANRYQLARYITLPSLKPTILVLFILGLGGILNAGFDQVLNLYNPAIISKSDILDTYIYRMGIESFQYSISTAVSVFKNVVGLIMVLSANMVVKKMTHGEQGIW